MFRGRSENKDNSNSRPPRKTKADPRAGEASKKIRRIDASGTGPGRSSDPTEIGSPPSGPPPRQPMNSPDGTIAGTEARALPGGLADRAPSLPPLKQPTANIPRIPVAEVSPEPSPPSALDVSSSAGPSSPWEDSAGVFGEDRRGSTSSVADQAAEEISASEQAKSAKTPVAETLDSETSAEKLGVPETSDVDRFVGVGAAAVTGAGAAAMASSDPFETASSGQQTAPAGRRVANAPSDATRPHARNPGAASSSPPSGFGRSAGPGIGGSSAEYGGIGEPEPLPQKSRRSNSGRGSGEPPQDTEFKLAGGGRSQKPKEPNRLLLGLGLGLILLLGAAGAWYFTRDTGPDVAADGETESLTTDTSLPEGEAQPAAPAVAEPAAEPAVDEPTLFFDAATTGPLTEGETYGIDLVGEPDGSTLQVIVDDIPQGEPDALLPDLILPAGRHTLYIQITNGAEVTASTPVELYVQGDPPPQGFRANLSSVDQQTEGWTEALRQFDEYRAAGHEGLQMFPISAGYWNIFVGDLGEERSAAQTYCESFSLAVPDDCFPTYYESAAGAAPTETTVAPAPDAESDAESDVMTDGEDATSTTVAGG